MSAKKDIGTALKTAMDGYETKPRVNLWPAIEADLKRKKKRSFLRILLIGIVTFLVGVSLFLTWSQESSSPKDSVNTETHPSDNSNTQQENDSIKNNTKDISTNPNGKDAENIDSTDNKEYPKTDIDAAHPSINTNREVPKLTTKTTSSTQNRRGNNGSKKTNPRSQNIQPQNGQNTLSINPNSLVKNAQDDILYKKDSLLKSRKPNKTQLKPVDLKRLEALTLKIDSLRLKNFGSLKDTTTSEKDKEYNWSLLPYISLDRYDAFGLATTDQNSINQGIYLSFYSEKRLAIRTGFKRLNLQYNFLNNTRQQQINYSEIPMEARYFIGHKTRFKTSFIVGGSYLFLQNATLIDFTNNITRDNRDFFNRNIFAINAGLGLHYDLTKRWRMNLESRFNYHPTPFTRKQSYTPYNLSFSFGLEYRFFLK